MSQFEYIGVLVSVVTGLAIVRLLSGVAQFLSNEQKPYWVHLLWTWNTFHFIAFFWWFFWRWSAITEWNMLLFMFILIYAVVVYMLSALLFPAGPKNHDFKDVFEEKRAWYFGFWVIAMLVDIVDTYWKVQYGLSGFGWMLITIWAIIISCSVIAALTSNRYFHAIWAVTFFLIFSLWEFVNFSTLRTD